MTKKEFLHRWEIISHSVWKFPREERCDYIRKMLIDHEQVTFWSDGTYIVTYGPLGESFRDLWFAISHGEII